MQGTRDRALEERRFLLGEDQAPLAENFKLAGADHFRASIPHSITVPQRVRQKVISRRPELSIPLGPKGLGITAQRLTTRVEQPLNSILTDRKAGFRWEDAADITLLEGFCASITVVDPADWQKHPSAWDGDGKDKRWKKKYRLDRQGRDEEDDGYEQDDARARKRYEDDLDWHRARNVPIRHKAVSILNCAPIFGPDLSTEGLIVDEEYSLSRLRRMYHFGESGLATPTGGSSESTSLANTHGGSGRAMHLISYWAYDDDGIPYVSYCVQGANGEYQETRWKGGDKDGEIACINLKERFGLDRLPVSWRWGLGWNTANPDHRSLPFTRPFRPGWKTVNSMLTGVAVWVWWRGFPTLIEEVDPNAPPEAEIEGDSPPEPQVIMPMQVLRVRGTIKEIMTQGPDAAVFKAIDIHLGANESESPGKSNKDQSGFSQSMAEGFEEMALTTVRQSLAELYEDHGSFVLEAGKRMPEMPKEKGSPGFAPIMVFRSTDVPTSDAAGDDSRNEPMELDPDLIDETFTTVAKYRKEMSIPERQQSMESVERRLKTRRQHLEDDGNLSPETTELELIAEDQRALPEYQQYLLKLVAELQGAEELEEIAKGQQEGIMNDTGMPTGAGAGGMDPAMLPPGMMAPPPQGALMPGVPQDGSVTGMGGGSMGTQALAGTMGGATMAGPMNNVTAAGGVLPPDLPTPGM